MADKKPSGFKTFLLLVFTIVTASVLGCAAFLMFVPDANIFGICYISNTNTNHYTKVGESESQEVATYSKTLNFGNYDKVVVDASNSNVGNANVKVNCGTVRNDSDRIALIEGTRGFANQTSIKNYEIKIYETGRILHINLVEPQFVVKISSGTVLELNIDADRILNNVQYDIKTFNGNITFGGSTAVTVGAEDINTPNLKLESVNGSINVDSSVSITSSLTSSVDIKTAQGTINIEPNLTAKNIKLSALKNKIIAPILTGNTEIVSYNSHIIINKIIGDLTLNTESGICEIAKVEGSVLGGNELKFTAINIKEITNHVSINNGTDFSFYSKKIDGTININAGSKNIVIEEINGRTEIIKTTSGAINVTKSSYNNNSFKLESFNGSITAKFNSVLQNNVIKSTNGYVYVQFATSSAYNLTATSGRGVFLDWLDVPIEKSYTDKSIGSTTPLSSNILNIKTNNAIKIGRF